jgi:hypothetical protein
VPWISPTIFGLIGGSIVLTLVFAWWLNRAPEPFLPLRLLANPVMRAGTTGTACGLGVMTGLMIYLPLYYQLVHGLNAAQSGLALIPVIIMTTPGAMTSGRAMMYMRRYKIAAYGGTGLTVATCLALVIWPAMPLWMSIVAAGLIGYGVGTVFPVATVSIQNAVPPHAVGIATGAMNFFRALVSALVVAIMGAILLAGLGVTPERGGVGTELVAATAGSASVDGAAVFRLVFAAALFFAVIAAIAVVVLEERPLHGPDAKTPPVTPDATSTPAE